MSQSENKPAPKPAGKSRQSNLGMILLVIGWPLLLCLSAALAVCLPKTVRVESLPEGSASQQRETVTLVEDIDYYGYYTPNPLQFHKITSNNGKGAYTISGLKDRAVQEDINSLIYEVGGALQGLSDYRSTVHMTVGANYYNILSFYISAYEYPLPEVTKFFTIDLLTGKDIRFDDLFSPEANIEAIIYKAFYDKYATSIGLEILYEKRKLAYEAQCPNPATCTPSQDGPSANETYEEIRARIAGHEERLANVEETALEAMRDYLAGPRYFYLGSFGPILVLEDSTEIRVKLEDNIRYAVYLKNYQTAETIFEKSSSSASNPFMTELPFGDTEYYNVETEDYLFDYKETISENVPLLLRESFVNYILEQSLAKPAAIAEGKYRHILVNSEMTNEIDFFTASAEVCLYEMDKGYYSSTFRKAIIDGKTKLVLHGNPTPQLGEYDKNRVRSFAPSGNLDCSYFYTLMTLDGEIYDDLDDILQDSPELSWRDYLRQATFDDLCNRSYRPICYTEAEQKAQNIIYKLISNFIMVGPRDDDSYYGVENYYTIGLSKLPKQYLREEFREKRIE